MINLGIHHVTKLSVKSEMIDAPHRRYELKRITIGSASGGEIVISLYSNSDHAIPLENEGESK